MGFTLSENINIDYEFVRNNNNNHNNSNINKIQIFKSITSDKFIE